MTAISPLETVHKKGLYGDHHKKNEVDLIKISEVKNLFIFQIVQYKKSKVQLNDIKIDDLEFPIQNSIVSSNKKTRILWNGPRTYLIISEKENISKLIKESCDANDFAITDISHSRAVIQIKGDIAKEVLKKGCPLNFNEFKKNNCVNSIFNGISVTIDMINEKPNKIRLLVLRSFGESFYHSITDSCLEHGYKAI